MIRTNRMKHDRPIRATEAAQKRPFIHPTGRGRRSRMRVDPHASKTFGGQTPIDLFIKEIRHGGILKLDCHRSAALPHHLDVFNQQQIVFSRDPEPAHFGLSQITQEQELGPRPRSEPQRRPSRSLHSRPIRPPRSRRRLFGIRRIGHRSNTPGKSCGGIPCSR